jgi:hypothetical protein
MATVALADLAKQDGQPPRGRYHQGFRKGRRRHFPLQEVLPALRTMGALVLLLLRVWSAKIMRVDSSALSYESHGSSHSAMLSA